MKTRHSVEDHSEQKAATTPLKVKVSPSALWRTFNIHRTKSSLQWKEIV